IHARVSETPLTSFAAHAPVATAAVTGLAIAVYDNLRAVETVWRAFENVADCTAFQAFDWHDAWQKTIGAPAGVRPAIAVVRDRDRMVAIFPFQVRSGRFVTTLEWHASDLCDYNAPLLAPDFGARVAESDFPAFFVGVATAIAKAP